nr:MAG TPA: hypothetical protein [Caudoviricetes sp.]
MNRSLNFIGRPFYTIWDKNLFGRFFEKVNP